MPSTHVKTVKQDILSYHDANFTIDAVRDELSAEDYQTLIYTKDDDTRHHLEEKAHVFFENDTARASHVQTVGQYVEQDQDVQDQQWDKMEAESVANPEATFRPQDTYTNQQASTTLYEAGDIRNDPVWSNIQSEAEVYGLTLAEIQKYDPKGYDKLPTEFDWERQNEYINVRELEGRPYIPEKIYDSGVKGLLEKYDDNYQSVTDAIAESEDKLLPSSNKLLGLGAEATVIALVVGYLAFKLF